MEIVRTLWVWLGESIVAIPAVIGGLWWFLSENGRRGSEGFWSRIAIVLVELSAQAVYVPLIIVLSCLFPKDEGRRTARVA